MTAKPLIPRQQDRRDIEAATDFYSIEADDGVAVRFIDAVEAAPAAIGRNPAVASPRYGHEVTCPVCAVA